MRLLLLGVVVLAAAGCTKPNPASCSDNHCSDPARPFCDVDGTIGGEPETCIAVACTPNEFAECRGDAALTCNAAGNSYDLLECEFGCGDTGCNEPPPPPPCTTLDCMKHIIPKYLPTICDTLATEPTLDITSDSTFDTGGVNCTKLVSQETGPEICVMRYGSIAIAPSITYRVTGTRLLALVADSKLEVNGVLDISGKGGIGPGGGFKLSGSGTSGAGGGGAGGQTGGGPGATTQADGGAQNQGAQEQDPSLSTELFGGTCPNNTLPNAGGGATLITCRGETSVTGLIDAGGKGGGGGRFIQTTYSQPVGGSSGGTIVLQGMNVSVTGELYANGGGGGGGGNTQLGTASAGEGGTRSVTPAAGGTSDGGGIGGTGGAISAPGAGKAASVPGAGGGAAGFLLVFTAQDNSPNISPVAVSPAFSPNHTVPTN